MFKAKNYIDKLPDFQKIIFAFLALLSIGMIFISSRVETIARYRDRESLSEVSLWDGSAASAYNSGDGTVNNPYMITNGSELAYFSEQLSINNYENTYFLLGNDIMLNEGMFDYNLTNDETKYIINDYIYDFSPLNGKYFYDETEIGTVNSLNPLNGFKGIFDGGMFTIYGLFASGDNNLALFTNLEGTVKNLFVENAMIYGGSSAAGIASNANGASLKNILFNGYVIGDDSVGSVSGGIAANANASNFENIVNKALVYGYSSGGLIGKVSGESSIKHAYNTGEVKGAHIAGGLIGQIENNSELTLEKTYNNATVTATDITGGLIGDINSGTGSVSINYSFNTTLNSIGQITDSSIEINNSYIIDGSTPITNNVNSTVTGSFLTTTIEDLKIKNFLLNTLNYSEFNSFNDAEANTQNVWVYKNNSFPVLFNEDYITDAYNMTDFKIGRDILSYTDETVNITDKSVVRLNYIYSNFPIKNLSESKHKLVSNIDLPTGTRIILIDNIKKKEYEYTVVDSNNVLSFESFKECGADDKFYTEGSYYSSGIISESFTVILDFSLTEFSSNSQDVSMHIELRDIEGNLIRETLNETIRKFNIYKIVEEEDSSAILYLSTDYAGAEILYNRDSTTEINISSGLYYKYINGIKVIDTTFENKEMGLSIKLVNENGETLDRKYLKNIKFMVDDQLYYPEKDNIVRIKINTSIEDIIKTLKIITYESNNDLEDGIYYFKISNFVSDDGKYYDTLGSTELSIPVKVDNRKNSLYSFDVIMNEENRIIEKSDEEVQVSFKILQNSVAEDPNVRISLYKKNYLTAYDQTYSIVDLKDYISDNLSLYANKVYYALRSPVQYSEGYAVNNFYLSLITSEFENIGYKFVFDLYDGNKKVGTIEKYFVVKSEGA